jgi:hypothetical protein
MKKLVFFSLLVTFTPGAVNAATRELPPDEQRTLALQFAPILVFHPDEKYLPCSPEIWGSSPEGLNPSEYASWAFADKSRNAVIFYRVFSDGNQRVIEYWAYYTYNDYRAGGGVFRFWSDVSHSNDLEFIFLTLGRDQTSGTWKVEKIISSAHRTNNVHNIKPTDAPIGRLRFLVELGSHASALDLDGDGRFTPSVEGRSSSKLVWGVRDRGNIWARYSSSFSSPRTDSEAILLYPEGAAPVLPFPRRQAVYGLRNVRELETSLPEWQDRLPKTPRTWILRPFGKPNGGSLSLALPSKHEDFGKPERAQHNRTAVERGFFVGYTPILYDYTLFAGGRYTHPLPSRYLPDAVFDGYALVCGDGNDYYEVQMVGGYPLDAISTVFAGCAILGDSADFDDRQLNWVAGLEVRLGRFRFRPSFRGTGPVSSAWLDFRLMWFF